MRHEHLVASFFLDICMVRALGVEVEVGAEAQKAGMALSRRS